MLCASFCKLQKPASAVQFILKTVFQLYNLFWWQRRPFITSCNKPFGVHTVWSCTWANACPCARFCLWLVCLHNSCFCFLQTLHAALQSVSLWCLAALLCSESQTLCQGRGMLPCVPGLLAPFTLLKLAFPGHGLLFYFPGLCVMWVVVFKKYNLLLSLIEKCIFGSGYGNISTFEKSLDLVRVPFPCIP